MKKYIIYRYYPQQILGWTYERVEYNYKEMLEYISNHLGDLDNIEIFEEKCRRKVSVELKVDI